MTRFGWYAVAAIVVAAACGTIKATAKKTKSPPGATVGGGNAQPTTPSTPNECTPGSVPTAAPDCGTQCYIGPACGAALTACKNLDTAGNTTGDDADDCAKDTDAGDATHFGRREYCDSSCKSNCPVQAVDANPDWCAHTVATCCGRYANCLANAVTIDDFRACSSKAGAETSKRFLQFFKCVQTNTDCSRVCALPNESNADGAETASSGCPRYSHPDSCDTCNCSYGFLSSTDGNSCESIFCPAGQAPKQAVSNGPWACAAL